MDSPSLSAGGGLNLLPNFQKREVGLIGPHILEEGWWEGGVRSVTFFRGVGAACNFT